MQPLTPERPYGVIARALHWSLALLIVAQLVIGWTMPHVGRKTVPVGLVGAHVTVGVLIVLLVAFRLVWRIVKPPLASAAPRTLATGIARLGHVALYLMMIVVPVLGWANANSRGWIVGVSEMFAPDGHLPDVRLPSLMEKGSALGHEFGDIHGTLALVFAILAGLHLALALYHHFVLRDGTLRKMM
jgi:cytochrome b561